MTTDSAIMQSILPSTTECLWFLPPEYASASAEIQNTLIYSHQYNPLTLKTDVLVGLSIGYMLRGERQDLGKLKAILEIFDSSAKIKKPSLKKVQHEDDEEDEEEAKPKKAKTSKKKKESDSDSEEEPKHKKKAKSSKKTEEVESDSEEEAKPKNVKSSKKKGKEESLPEEDEKKELKVNKVATSESKEDASKKYVSIAVIAIKMYLKRNDPESILKDWKSQSENLQGTKYVAPIAIFLVIEALDKLKKPASQIYEIYSRNAENLNSYKKVDLFESFGKIIVNALLLQKKNEDCIKFLKAELAQSVYPEKYYLLACQCGYYMNSEELIMNYRDKCAKGMEIYIKFLFKIKKFDLVEKELASLIQKDPRNPDPSYLILFGDTLYAQKKYKEALSQYLKIQKKIIEEEEDDDDNDQGSDAQKKTYGDYLNYLIGRCYFYQKKYKEAANSLNKCKGSSIKNKDKYLAAALIQCDFAKFLKQYKPFKLSKESVLNGFLDSNPTLKFVIKCEQYYETNDSKPVREFHKIIEEDLKLPKKRFTKDAFYFCKIISEYKVFCTKKDYAPGAPTINDVFTYAVLYPLQSESPQDTEQAYSSHLYKSIQRHLKLISMIKAHKEKSDNILPINLTCKNHCDLLFYVVSEAIKLKVVDYSIIQTVKDLLKEIYSASQVENEVARIISH